MFFGSYAEGAKPGGFNGEAGAAVGAATYDQEESTNYEIGVKSILFGEEALDAPVAAMPDRSAETAFISPLEL